MNLREEPDKIALLPELTDCPPLRDFVIALNALSGQFEAFGCEKWIGPRANDAFPGYGFRQGCYVDIALVNKEICATQRPYRQLIDTFRQYAVVHRVYDLMHVGFELRPTVSAREAWWTMGVWICGIGRDEADAKQWWPTALEYSKCSCSPCSALV